MFIIPSCLFAQKLDIDAETNKYTTQVVEEFEGKKKQELFSKTVEWIALNYKDADKVTKLKDESSGKIILKGNFSTDLYMKKGWIRHTMIVDIKDEKLRITFTDLSYFSTGSGDISFESPMMGKKKAIAEAELRISESINSIYSQIRKSTISDDW